jgi:GT2 family glycosyltransferase
LNFAAGIPVYGAVSTLPRVLAALRGLAPAPAEMLVVDDGSAQPPTGVRVILHGANLGRGAARATIMRETRAPLVLMCDATVEAEAGFAAGALHHFTDPKVAAVFARITQAEPRTCVERWRGRHLFKMDASGPLNRRASLGTGLCILRRSAVEAVGGFNPAQRSGEDADLGCRLLAAGWDVIADPALRARCLVSDSPATVLRRFARWNSPGGLDGRAFVRQFVYAAKVMARADLRAHDPLAALLSLASPFYQLRRR